MEIKSCIGVDCETSSTELETVKNCRANRDCSDDKEESKNTPLGTHSLSSHDWSTVIQGLQLSPPPPMDISMGDLEV